MYAGKHSAACGTAELRYVLDSKAPSEQSAQFVAGPVSMLRHCWTSKSQPKKCCFRLNLERNLVFCSKFRLKESATKSISEFCLPGGAQIHEVFGKREASTDTCKSKTSIDQSREGLLQKFKWKESPNSGARCSYCMRAAEIDCQKNTRHLLGGL